MAASLGLWQIITRFVIERAAEWTGVLIRFSLIWMVFLGVPLAFRVGAMVSVDVLYRWSGACTRRVLDGVVALAALLLVAVKEMLSSINKLPLAAIPFLIMAGNIMGSGGISRRLVEFGKSIVGGVQGALPMSCVLTCMIFAAVSGSSVDTTFAIGAILGPALVRHGYPPPYAAALQAASTELGVIVPPSIPLIPYGVSAEVSIGELFIAGIVPADLLAVLRRSVVSSSVIMFIIANAGLFAYLIARVGVPGPNLAPVAVFFGIDAVHFGIVMVVNLALDMITQLVPFVLVVLGCLMVITYFPAVALTLRDWVYH
ncbi:MAG TPA: TRAP transporter large permease subunit [Rubrivivax sp.]|nr:TRAP transporter large permease subunit [Rubrivivax sp.]